MKYINKKQTVKSIMLLCSVVAANSLFAGTTYQAPVSKMVEKSFESIEIDRNTYVIETLRAYFAPESVSSTFKDKGYGETSTRMITPLLIEAKRAYASLKSEDKAFIDALLKRPTDTTHVVDGVKMYLPAPVLTFEPDATTYPNIGGKFKFWYVTHATEDAGGHTHTTTLAKVKEMAAAFDNVYKEEIGTMGYSVPPSDTGSPSEGGDKKFDIYLLNTGSMSIYGYVSPDAVAAGGDGNEWYSHMVMDNDFKEFVTPTMDALSAMKVTAAHEYHHAIQMGINTHADTWYMEATSTWMEEKVYDDVNDNRQYIDSVMLHPEVSLDNPTSHWYGTWIFNEYLSTRWDNNIVKDVWDKLDNVGNDNALEGLNDVLTSKPGTVSFSTIYTNFWAKNYQKDKFYDEGTHWPSAKIENKTAPHVLDFSTDESSNVLDQALTLNHEASKLYKFKAGDTLFDKQTLNILVEANKADDISASVVAKRRDGTFKEYTMVFNDEGEGEVGIPGFSSVSMDEVVLIVTNHSLTDNDLAVKYDAYLAKPITFVIDDTGSMGSEISAAKQAIKTVLNANKSSGKHFFYTLLSYKDGPARLRGQSSDEDTMIALTDTLYASGGSGCPESALLSVRQATELAENSDIYIMTDADSNSYGVDNTYATWGELWETVANVLDTHSHVHAIIYGECYYYGGKTKSLDQDGSCGFDKPLAKALLKTDKRASGMDGYTAMSGETGGLYFRATSYTTEDITEIILTHSSADASIVHMDINGSGTYTLPIDNSIDKFEIVANTNVGVTATMKITDPTGKLVSNGDDGVSSIDVSGNSFYLIEDSAVKVGNWSIEVNATGIYTLASKGFTSKVLSYMGDMSTGINGELTMKLSIGNDVSNPKFYLVDLSDGSKREVALSKIGNIYAGKTIMPKSGSYRILVVGDDFYQRTYPSKIDVNGVYIDAPSSVILPPLTASNLTYTFGIENKSDTNATYTVEATATMSWADLSKFPMHITLAAGAKDEIKIDVNVTADAKSGDIDVLSIKVFDEEDSTIRSTTSVETRIGIMYDLDEDGDVDVTDIMMVASKWGAKKGDPEYSLTLDLNDDGFISIKDIMMVASQWGWTKD